MNGCLSVGFVDKLATYPWCTLDLPCDNWDSLEPTGTLAWLYAVTINS